MIFALLVVVAGAILLAGWAQLLATRATFADAADDGSTRRIILENARAIARQHILTNMPSGSVPQTNITISTPWGNRTISINYRSGFWDSTNQLPSGSADNNPFSPMERLGFFTTIDGSLTDGVTNYPWTFRVRTRSPIAAGFGYVLHAGASFSNTSYLPTNYIDYRSGSNATNIVGTYSNFPRIPMTSYTNGSSNYYGYFNLPVITNTNAGTGSYYDGTAATSPYFYGVTNIQSNSIEITLDPTNTNSVLRFAVPDDIANRTFTNSTNTNTNFRYTNRTHNVVALRIQSSTNTNTLHIISTNGDHLTNVVLGGSNNARKIYLNRAGDNTTLNLTTTNTNNASWRLGMTLSNTPLVVSYANTKTLTIIGGIRSNAQIRRATNNGDWVVNSETTNAGIEPVADRIMWLEDYPTP